MPSSDKREDDFFDSVSCLSAEREDLDCKCQELEFDVWLKEPQSVARRRQVFLSKMNLSDFACSSDDSSFGLERMTDSGGAVSRSWMPCTNIEEERPMTCARETSSQANSVVVVDEMDREPSVRWNIEHKVENCTRSSFECEHCEVERRKSDDAVKRKMKRWWLKTWKERKGLDLSDSIKEDSEAQTTNIVKVRQNKKKFMEFAGVFMGQEIQGHKGYIVSMKFSPDGQFLATGGEDRIVRIWRVTSADASCKAFPSQANNLKEHNPTLVTKRRRPVSVVIPDEVFQIDESPLQEFHGHAGEILDVAWSNSNYILSSSLDKTVRLWKLGCSSSLHVFHHSNYVTCIQFNPVDEQYFISGSIDGKLRIWGVSEKRVVYWADVRDAITAVCYQPDGKGIVVGTIRGNCRVYEVSGNDLHLMAELHVQGRKKNYGNRITGIQVSEDAYQRVLITSEDSKLRIFDGVDMVQKFKGLPKSGSQMSASFASTGRHIISVGEDCRVFAWNYDGINTPSSKHIKSVQSCEYFSSENVSVAVPWSGLARNRGEDSRSSIPSQAQTELNGSWRKDSRRFSLGGWFSMDGPCSKGSQTWPEEKLPLLDESATGDDYYQNPCPEFPQQHLSYTNDPSSVSDAWGLAIVTAGLDGKIRTFQNYGLPIKL